MQQVNAVHGFRQYLLQGLEALSAARPALGDFEYQAFRFVNQFGSTAAFRRKGLPGYFVAGVDQRAQHCPLPHDIGVGARVCGPRRLVGQGCEILEATRRAQLAALLQKLRYRHNVAGVTVFHELGDRLEDEPVVFAVEILGTDNIADLIPSGLVEHQPAEQRLLGFDRVGRNLEAAFLVHAAALSQRSNHETPARYSESRRLRYHSPRPPRAAGSAVTRRYGFPGAGATLYSSATTRTVTSALISGCR